MEGQDPKWYVVHTYSGHENKVKTTIEKTVANRNMENIITRVEVPVEEIAEKTKTGKEKVRERKIFPSYVIVKMIMNDESWYVVRNTKGVTGFVGPGSKPVPLSEDEVIAMGIEDVAPRYTEGEIDLEIGDAVKIMRGPFRDHVGKLEEINLEKREVKIGVDLFGRQTLVTLELESIEKL